MKPILQEPGGIIVVRKGVLDYSMSQITQIVETIMESFWAYSYQSQVLIALKLR
jgi:hypothetical protein